MKQYHKIQSVYKRNPETKFRTFLTGEYSEPEFEYLADAQWEWTEKVDGTNIRVIWDGENLLYRGKSDRANIPGQLLENLRELFDSQWAIIDDMFPNGVCFYGEGYGPKIQNGAGYREDQGFVLFDIKCGDNWLKRSDVESIATSLKLDVVPIIGTGTLDEAIALVKQGFNSTWGDFLAEGLILKPTLAVQSHKVSRIITKIKHKDFVDERN